MAAKAVSFVAKSAKGKTTLLEKVITRLKELDYTVGVVKHDQALIAVASDEPLDLDVPLLDLNDTEMVTRFIELHFVKQTD